MDREINLDSIRALEEQIREHERAIIQLKRTRNSLLNVSTLLPPEILGKVFHWNVIPDGDFDGLPKASHNFLLVCHHWFLVAVDAPGLWGFWGNSIQDWARQHVRRRTSPLNLVLAGCASGHLDDTLRDALQDRAMRDTIQRVHLKGASVELLNSIISSITTKGKETRSNSAESFVLQNHSKSSNVDVSDFFSQYHFPKLQRLLLFGFVVSSWDLLESRTTSLTTLELAAIKISPLPTLSQMLSILSANPNLQHLRLSHDSVPDVDSDRPSFQIQLCHLKTFHLESNPHRVFGLLDRLELPDKMDHLNLSLYECQPPDLPQTLGPYLRNHIRRRSPDRLKLSVTSDIGWFFITMEDIPESDFTWGDPFVEVEWIMSIHLGKEEANKLCFDIFVHFSPEVVEVSTNLPILRSGELCVQMCNLTHLHLELADASTWFTEPDIPKPHVFKDLLPRLRSILITNFRRSGEDWNPFTDFLTRRAAVGNRIYSLSLRNHSHMGEDVVESIRRSVEVFKDERERR
jgi:hypothetical protein